MSASNENTQMKPQKLSQADLSNLARLDSDLLNEIAAWASKSLTCSHCKKCTLRCEVLKEPGLDIGLVEDGYKKILALPPEDQPDAVLKVADEHPELYRALRRCCFCGFCTAACKTHMLAPDRMREWRNLFMKAGLLQPDESKLVMVDNEWHIFSAYRAIHNISYPEFTTLQEAATHGPGLAEVLFFPGCSLVSYAPELTRKVGKWLDSTGIAWAMSDDCCGSPLESAGLVDRAEAQRNKLLSQMRSAGIKRMLTVCPGCGEEFAEAMGGEIDIIPFPEFLVSETKAGFDNAESIALLTPLQPSSVTVFDACHDRFDNRHGTAIRKLLKRYLPDAKQFEMRYSRKGTLCCGAGGAVSGYDDEISQKRVWRVIEEGRATGAETLVTMCPTCTYTIAQACLGADPTCGIDSHHYLELVFGEIIDWQTVFDQLQSMWSGEYGPWLSETFFS